MPLLGCPSERYCLMRAPCPPFWAPCLTFAQPVFLARPILPWPSAHPSCQSAGACHPFVGVPCAQPLLPTSPCPLLSPPQLAFAKSSACPSPLSDPHPAPRPEGALSQALFDRNTFRNQRRPLSPSAPYRHPARTSPHLTLLRIARSASRCHPLHCPPGVCQSCPCPAIRFPPQTLFPDIERTEHAFIAGPLAPSACHAHGWPPSASHVAPTACPSCGPLHHLRLTTLFLPVWVCNLAEFFSR